MSFKNSENGVRNSGRSAAFECGSLPIEKLKNGVWGAGVVLLFCFSKLLIMLSLRLFCNNLLSLCDAPCTPKAGAAFGSGVRSEI